MEYRILKDKTKNTVLSTLLFIKNLKVLHKYLNNKPTILILIISYQYAHIQVQFNREALMYVCVFLYFSVLLSVLLNKVIKIFLFYHSSICWGYHFQVFLAQMMKNLYSFMSSKKAMDNKNGETFIAITFLITAFQTDIIYGEILISSSILWFCFLSFSQAVLILQNKC